MKAQTSWTCPLCDEVIPIHLDTSSGRAHGSQVTVRVKVSDAALADVFAHAWAHPEVESIREVQS